MTHALRLAYDVSSSTLDGQLPRTFTLRPRADLRRFGLGLGAALIAGPIGFAAFVLTADRQSTIANPITFSDYGTTVGAVIVGLACLYGGASVIHRERRQWHKAVTLGKDGVEVHETCGAAEKRWSAQYGEFTGVVLSAVPGEPPHAGYLCIELRHHDEERSLLLHRSTGSALHPATRQLTRRLAAALGTAALVEIDEALIPLEE